ncbi:MAG: hypothetical protein ACT4NV_04740 [Rhodoferax sp.]
MSTKHLPPHLQRRSFLRLGLGAAAVLAVAGGSAVLLTTPGVVDGKLSAPARAVLRSVALAILADLLPTEAAACSAELDASLQRTDALLAAVPAAARDEASQLLALLGTSVGRRTLAGLATPWEQADSAEVLAALQSMQASSVPLRVQAYQGLHDLVCLPYFASAQAWKALGYPGPISV